MELYDTEMSGDHILFNHVQDVAPVIAMAERERKLSNNGWTSTRNMQLVGDIPDVVFFNHPEFYNDDKALRKWLASDEGEPYRIGHLKHRGDTFKGVIVK